MSQSKYWCWTLNNYSDDDINTIREFKCKYCVFGKEIGESGTKHLQGYIEFETNHRLAALKKLHSGIHWELRRGTAKQAAEYCKKDLDFEQFGEISKDRQGTRSDIDDIKEMVRDGKGMKDILEYTNSYQAVKYAEKMLTHCELKRNWKPGVTWLWGPTGSGKTRLAMQNMPDAWISGKNLRWWEGYDAHENVLIDDFRADFCTFHELLRILDRYPYTIEVKGGSRQLLAHNIIITSCYPPDKVYSTREDIAQLLRRIDKIIHLGIGMEVAGNTDTATDDDKKYDDVY